MVAFYNAADQELYKKYKFLPQEKYRLGLTLPTDPVADPVAPVPGGITNTNAFNNSGNDFNQSGNMFGEGTKVNPAYGGNPITGGFDGGYGADPISGDLPGGGNIVDEFGTDGEVYSKGAFDNIKEEEEKKNFLSKMMSSFRQKTENLPDWAKKGMTAAGMIAAPIPTLLGKIFGSGSGGGGGSYGIAGLTDQQKSMYNNLAASGFLYDSNGIMKTKTGKNFSGKGYKEGQQDIYNEMMEEGYTLDSNGNVVKPDGTLASGYLKEKFLESNIIGKDNTNTNTNITNPNLTTNMINEFATINNDTITNPNITSNIVDEFSTTTNNDGPTTTAPPSYSYTPSPGDGGQGGSNNSGDHDGGASADAQSDDAAGAGGYARGGRAGYFFGGRVNYKKGGRGRTDAESQYGADSAGSYDSSQNKSGRQQSYGGDNNSGARDNPPVSNYDYSKLVDQYKEEPDYTLGNIELNKNLTNNTRLNTILNLQKTVEDKKLAGQLELDKRLGSVDTTLTYGTDQKPKLSASYMNYSPTLGGIYANADSSDGLGVNYAYNNIGANADFDNSGKFERAGITYDNNGVALGLDTQDGVTASYSKDIFDGTGQIKAGGRYDPITGEYNAEGKISFPFANGGLAGLL